MSLKNAFESHPMIIAIGAVSLFLNVAQAALGGYSSLFGERPIISESYFFVPLESSETIVDGEFNGNLVGLGCKVVHSEIRSIYTDVKVEKGMGPGPHGWGAGKFPKIIKRLREENGAAGDRRKLDGLFLVV